MKAPRSALLRVHQSFAVAPCPDFAVLQPQSHLPHCLAVLEGHQFIPSPSFRPPSPAPNFPPVPSFTMLPRSSKIHFRRHPLLSVAVLCTVYAQDLVTLLDTMAFWIPQVYTGLAGDCTRGKNNDKTKGQATMDLDETDGRLPPTKLKTESPREERSREKMRRMTRTTTMTTTKATI